MGVPLISSERLIGCLAAFSLTPEVEFTPADLDLFVTLSGQASVAVENVLLYEQIQHRATQLENLNQIATLISASLDLNEVLTRVCHSVTEVGGALFSAIYLLDYERGDVWLAQAEGFSPSYVQQNQRFPFTHGGRTRCLRTGQPALAPQLKTADLEGSYVISLRREGIQAFGDFPLITPDGQIGFLSVYFDQPHVFSDEEVDLLQTFAAQAAIAVENARLYARTDMALSQRAHQLSVLEAVGRELAAAIQSAQLFEMILDYAVEFTNSQWGNISIYHPTSDTVEIKAYRGYQDPPLFSVVDESIGGQAIRCY